MANYKSNNEIMRNMEFIIDELKKEWDMSKETKHYVGLSIAKAEKIRKKMQQYIISCSAVLNEDDTLSFKQSMKYCRDNNIMFRLARKLITKYDYAVEKKKDNIVLELDKEEFKAYREIVGEKTQNEGKTYMQFSKRVLIDE